MVQSNLSGAAFTGDGLWVAGDEACGLDRLRRLDPIGREALRFGEVRDFALVDLLDLPRTAGKEDDLEGMAIADGFLWMVGSHGLKRKNVKPDRGHTDNAKRLAKVALDGNRRLLARLPIEADGGGEPASCVAPRMAARRCARRVMPKKTCSPGRWPMTPTSCRTWQLRARTTASTSKAWPSTAAGCCSVCAARSCGADWRCWRSRSSPAPTIFD